MVADNGQANLSLTGSGEGRYQKKTVLSILLYTAWPSLSHPILNKTLWYFGYYTHLQNNRFILKNKGEETEIFNK